MTEKSTSQVFSEGLVQLLYPVVKETDERVQLVFNTQEELQQQIQRLSKELENFVEVSQTPALSPYVQKLSNSKQKMDQIQLTLQQIQERLARIERVYGKRIH